MALQRNLAHAFDSIPASKISYRPTSAQLSIGYIAQHLATDNYLFCDRFGAMKSARPAGDTAAADSVKATWPKGTLVTLDMADHYSQLANFFGLCSLRASSASRS